MPIILSLTYHKDTLYAAGPEGLFRYENGELLAVAQPQSELACCAAVDSRVLVGGLPYGVAFTLVNGGWQAGWMDGVGDSVFCIAADPRAETTGVVLAGSAGGGILRSQNRGQTWSLCNFGLQEFNVLALAWAPIAPADAWPRWEVVFAGTEAGLYRSPNGGRGWKHCAGVEGVVQSIAVDPHFHNSGLVLAGTESNGLWRSSDGGRQFERVTSASERINALLATNLGLLMSDDSGLWQSSDGANWQALAGSRPALTLAAAAEQVWGGNDNGVFAVEMRG